MTTTFPYAEKKITRGCVYLPTNDRHNRLLADLEQSMVVHTSNPNENGEAFLTRVRQYIVQIFGGNQLEFSYLKTSYLSYVIKIPTRLNRQEVINAGNSWGNWRGYWFDFWTIERNSEINHCPFRVRISILNFPLYFWDPDFIANLVSQFGEVESIDEPNVTGTDRSVLNIWITCLDVKRIPPVTTIPFGERWTECTIRIAEWQYIGWVPPEARLTEGDGSPFRLTGTFAQARWSLMRASEKILYYIAIRPPTYPTSESSSSESMAHNFSDGPPTMANSGLGLPAPGLRKDMLTKNPANTIQGNIKPTQYTSSLQIGQYVISIDNIFIQSTYPEDSIKEGEEWGEKKGDTGIQKGVFRFSVMVGQISILHVGEVHTCTLGPTRVEACQKSSTMIHNNSSTSDFQGRDNKCRHTTKALQTKKASNPTAHQPAASKLQPHHITLNPTQANIHHQTKPHHSQPTNEIHCSTKKEYHTIQPINKANSPPHSKQTQHTIQTKEHTPHKKNKNCSLIDTMASSDEEFITRFASLSSSTATTDIVQIPLSNIKQRDWHKCGMLHIVSESPIQDSQFPTNMTRIWAAKSETSFSMIGLNMYLVEFTSEQELLRIMNKGVWTYRTEVVAIQRVRGSADLARPMVRNIEVWVQWHGIPLEAITNEGLLTVSNRIGKPLSEVHEGFVNGNKFFRIKTLIPIDATIQESLPVDHPILGNFKVYLVYEKLTKLCLFCAKIGHDRIDCPDKIRLDRLREDPRYADSLELEQIPSTRIGAWINNQAKLPQFNQPLPDNNQPTNQPQQNQPNTYHHGPTANQFLPTTQIHNNNTQEPHNQTSQILDQDMEAKQNQFFFTGTTSDGKTQEGRIRRYATTAKQYPKRTPANDMQIVGVEDPKNIIDLNDLVKENIHVKKKRALEAIQTPPPPQ